MIVKAVRFCILVVTVVLLVGCSASSSAKRGTSSLFRSDEITLPLSAVHFDSKYQTSVEYLEYGNVVEFCQRTRDEEAWEYKYGVSQVTLYISDDTSAIGFYVYEMELEPPNYRALKSAIGENYQGNFFIEVNIRDGEVVSIGEIIDVSGNSIWNVDMTENPRELTDIESAYLLFASKFRWEPENYLDLEESCEDTWEDYSDDNYGSEYERWSYIEYIARAFYANNKLFSTNDAGTWILSNQNAGKLETCTATDLGLRVLNSSGELLEPIACAPSEDSAAFSVPQDGWVVLQWVRQDGSWRRALETEVMNETIIDIMIGGIKIDLVAAPASTDVLAELTESWSDEEVIKYLSNPFGE